MTYLLLQTFLLLLASYFLGAFLACLVKRTLVGTRAAAPAHVPARVQIEAPTRPPVTATSPPPVRPRLPPPVAPPIASRPIDPVQPRIDVLRRPEPRPAPKLIDPTRFERALMGPEPNEGIPRKAIVELRPTVLKPVNGAYRPGTYRLPAPPPEPPPPPAPPAPPKVEARPSPVEPVSVTHRQQPAKVSGLSDATTNAAAGAVAAAKAAAAASTASAVRHQPVEPTTSQTPPSAAKAPEEAKPAAKAVPVVKVPLEGGDDLQRIRAIDADMEQQLKGLGVNYFEHIAAWTPPDVKRIGQALGIPGRIEREQWVEQGQILAKGGETYYSRNRLASQKASAPASTPQEASTSVSASSPADSNPPSASPSLASAAASPPAKSEAGAGQVPPTGTPKPTQLSGVAAASQGRSVAEMASAAAAAIAAASASVTRGLKPIEPISPLSRVDPKISIPAKLSDAIKERETASAAAGPDKDGPKPNKIEAKPAPASEGQADDLKRIRGIGVLIEKRLNAMGVSRYEQIANWTSGDIERVSQVLEFKGRIERESWVEQARILSSGGQTEFSRRVDRGEFDTSRET
jgi:predicted flap endonuclease-1-like 5' DNA nuclease